MPIKPNMIVTLSNARVDVEHNIAVVLYTAESIIKITFCIDGDL